MSVIEAKKPQTVGEVATWIAEQAVAAGRIKSHKGVIFCPALQRWAIRMDSKSGVSETVYLPAAADAPARAGTAAAIMRNAGFRPERIIQAGPIPDAVRADFAHITTRPVSQHG